MKKFLLLLVNALLFFCWVANASATVYRFSFAGSTTEYIEVGGNGATNPPVGVFAYLDFDTTINQFRLYDGPNAYLGSSALGQGAGLGVNGIAFNFGTTIPVLGDASYPSTGSSVFYDQGSMLGLASISLPAVLQNNGFNYAYKSLNNGVEVTTDAYKLIAGESETFAISGFNHTALSNLLGANFVTGNLNLQASSIAIRVQNSTGNGISWFTATSVAAVPEPQTYAMWLLGLMMLVMMRKGVARNAFLVGNFKK